MVSIRRFFQRNKKSASGSRIHAYDRPTDDAPRFGFSSAPAEWNENRENHYREWFGDSKDIFVWHEVLPLVPHIDIHVFPPSAELGRNYYTLITSGMSDEKMALPKGIDSQYARAELVFYVADALTKAYETTKPWFVGAMTFLAHFPFDFKTWLAVSHTIPNGNPPAPVVEGSVLTTALFLPPIFESKGFAQDFKLGDETVNFLWLTYISDKETEYKLKYGYDKLVEKFTPDNFPKVFNPFRSSII